MNFVLYDTRELDSAGMFAVTGERARHLIELLQVRPGTELKTIAAGIGRGMGRVEQVADGTVLIRPLTADAHGSVAETSQPFLWKADARPAPLHLVVATPRPQSVKKILEFAGAVGITSITFVAAEKVEQSFFSSSALRAQEIQKQLQLGMEQGGNPFAPEVRIVPWFKPSALRHEVVQSGAPVKSADLFASIGDAEPLRLLLHPGEGTNGAVAGMPVGMTELCEALRQNSERSVVAVIGPEGGWDEREVAAWSDAGCMPFSFGPAVLRVEHAVHMLTGQILALRAAIPAMTVTRERTAARRPAAATLILDHVSRFESLSHFSFGD